MSSTVVLASHLGSAVHDFTVIRPHDAMVDEFADETMWTDLRDAIANDEMPPRVHRQPHGCNDSSQLSRLWFPIALFVDEVRTVKLTASWGFCLGQLRYFQSDVRGQLCGTNSSAIAGVEAWCTHISMCNMFAWSLRRLLEDVWPEERHDCDAYRCEQASQRLGGRAALIFVKWIGCNEALRPCFTCNACGERVSTKKLV